LHGDPGDTGHWRLPAQQLLDRVRQDVGLFDELSSRGLAMWSSMAVSK